MTGKPIQWAAKLEHVREVSLLGTADSAFWQDVLRAEELVPAERDGRAQLLVIAADSRYMGIRFQELSFSVLVSRPAEGGLQDAAYLVRAFNSCRLFAFCERALFSTPYYAADVSVATELPASMRLGKKGRGWFEAKMAAAARDPSRHDADGWDGPVYLPRGPRADQPGKLFFAQIRGDTRRYPFLPSHDSVVLSSSENDVLQQFEDSHFVASEWIIREDAAHAKSKTYSRADVSKDVAAPVNTSPAPR